MMLASNSKKLHKSYTVILAVILFVTSLVEKAVASGLLETIQPYVSEANFSTFTMIASVAMIVGRYIKQSGLVVDPFPLKLDEGADL